jgi:hypothetical protein
MPEPKKTWDEAAMRQFQKRVAELANKSSLREPGSKERYMEIMMRHRDAYTLSLDHFKPGQLDVPKLRLWVSDGPPIVDRKRELSPEDEEWLRKQTLEFDAMGIWSPVTDEMQNQGLWVSNPVIVKQRDRENPDTVKRRLTVDFWGPNSRITPPTQRNPSVYELADRLGKAALMDIDDAVAGYYQWRLHEDDKHFTGVWTPVGIRVFNCMPLGINVAPAEWNAAMAAKFKDMPADRFFGLMDDFMRWTREEEGKTRKETEDSHLDLLEKFLSTVVKARITM